MNQNKELSITEIERLLGMSYPTALKYARENGHQNGDGKWLVPFDTVMIVVQRKVSDALRTQAEMWALENAIKSV